MHQVCYFPIRSYIQHSNMSIIFSFLFIITSSLIFFHSHGALSSSNSLILGLTHSKPVLPSPKPTFMSRFKPTDVLDMSEPLREVRDGYMISLSFGTPSQVIQVYMDTGSDLTWLPCGNWSFECVDCDRSNKLMLMSTFSPSSSSSSVRDTCSSHFCIDVHSSDNNYDTCTMAGCSLSTLMKGTCSRPCPSFAYTYGEGIVIGALTRDTLRIHGGNPSVTREVAKFCFGCVSNTYREPMGIVGFGRGPLSLPSQLGFLHKGFAHCFLPFKFANNPNMTSPLVLGSLAISSKDHLQFTSMLRSPMYPNYYYIGLEAITIGNVTLDSVPLSLRKFDTLGNGGMLIDSGTTYTHLPKTLFSSLLSTLESMITYPRANEVEERSGFDLCYLVPCPNNTFGDDYVFPSITFRFLNNTSIVLPRGNHFYAMGAPNNYSAVKCLLFQSMDEDSEYGPAGVFGSFQQQNMEIVYDVEKERIGFQQADCVSYATTYQGRLHKA